MEGTCTREPWAPDEPTPYGASPQALLGSMVGTYVTPVVWFSASAPHDCPRQWQGTSELTVVLTETGRAEFVINCGPYSEESSVRLGISARVQSSDGRADHTFAVTLMTRARGGPFALLVNDSYSVGPFQAGLMLQNDATLFSGTIELGDTVGGFPTSCPEGCTAEPTLEALELPVSVAQALDVLGRSRFFADEGRRVELQFETPLSSDRACLQRRDASSTAVGPAYSLPSRVNLAGANALSVPNYTSVRVTPSADCPECVQIATEVYGIPATTSPLWTEGATDVRVTANVQLTVAPDGARTGSGSLQVDTYGVTAAEPFPAHVHVLTLMP
jgi:hypothetical protein